MSITPERIAEIRKVNSAKKWGHCESAVQHCAELLEAVDLWTRTGSTLIEQAKQTEQEMGILRAQRDFWKNRVEKAEAAIIAATKRAEAAEGDTARLDWLEKGATLDGEWNHHQLNHATETRYLTRSPTPPTCGPTWW